MIKKINNLINIIQNRINLKNSEINSNREKKKEKDKKRKREIEKEKKYNRDLKRLKLENGKIIENLNKELLEINIKLSKNYKKIKNEEIEIYGLKKLIKISIENIDNIINKNEELKVIQLNLYNKLQHELNIYSENLKYINNKKLNDF